MRPGVAKEQGFGPCEKTYFDMLKTGAEQGGGQMILKGVPHRGAASGTAPRQATAFLHAPKVCPDVDCR